MVKCLINYEEGHDIAEFLAPRGHNLHIDLTILGIFLVVEKLTSNQGLKFSPVRREAKDTVAT
jgi:hypothetical protein